MELNLFPYTSYALAFKFFPVGHGLFYAGNIGGWQFIYDCGSRSGSMALDKVMIEYQDFNPKKEGEEKGEIDLFILSHLHHDHFNGIPKLLDKYNIKKLILPFCSEDIRLSVGIEYIVKSESNGGTTDRAYLDFLADPERYLQSLGVTEVIFVRNVDFIEQDNSDDNRTSERLNRSEVYGKDFKLVGELSDILNKSLQEKNGLHWDFHFHQKSITDIDLKKSCLFDRLTKKSGSSPGLYMREILGNIMNTLESFNKIDGKEAKKFLTSLSNVYKDTFLSPTGKQTSHNDESIIMVHTPRGQILGRGTVITNGSMAKTAGLYTHILTGDFPLRAIENWDNFMIFYNDLKINNERVGVFQIPHHGSDDNWNIEILNEFENALLVITAKLKDKKHPGIKVKSDLGKSCKGGSLIVHEESTGIIFY